jgi:hypothetical protein
MKTQIAMLPIQSYPDPLFFNHRCCPLVEQEKTGKNENVHALLLLFLDGRHLGFTS